MGRQPCCEKVGLKRGPWTIEEDNKLMDFILNNGIQCWRLVPKLAGYFLACIRRGWGEGLKRCGKSCRLRWINYLRPDLKRGAWTEAEEDMVIQLHSRLGNRWSKIAAHFPGRTDNEIKNHWNTKIKKRLQHLGLDSSTHKPSERDENSCATNQGLQEYDTPEQQEIWKVDTQKTTFLSCDYTKLEGDKALNPSLDEPKIGGTSQNITSEESSVLHDMKECPKMGTEQVPNAEWDCLMGIDHQTLSQEYDPFQNWITSPLAWDLFNSFEENFL